MNSPAALTVANDQAIIEMIRSAKERLIIMAPGVSEPVAAAIEERWRNLGPAAVTVILDVDPEVCRMGYGTLRALEMLREVASNQGGLVNNHPGIRIGLVIADGETLIYTPTPLLIEASPTPAQPQEQPKPNAIRIGLPPESLQRDLGIGPDGARERMVGLDGVTKEQTDSVSKNLAENPPQKFDVARSVRVFNAQFEFVEIEIKGAALQRKTVRLPNYLLGLEENTVLDQAMRATFRVVDRDSPVSGARLERHRQRIIRRYLHHLPGYGFIVLRRDKEKLVQALDYLRWAVESFRLRLASELQVSLDAKRKALAEVLEARITQRPNERRRLFLGTPKEIVEHELHRLFGSASDLIDAIQLRVVYKAVTYESLVDPKFVALVRDRVPALERLHEETTVARAIPMPPARTPPPTSMKGAA